MWKRNFSALCSAKGKKGKRKEKEMGEKGRVKFCKKSGEGRQRIPLDHKSKRIAPFLCDRKGKARRLFFLWDFFFSLFSPFVFPSHPTHWAKKKGGRLGFLVYGAKT
jgi:hypothetical protein